MKPIKVVLAGMLVGVSAFSFAACSACDGLPTWLGGKAPTYTVVIHINGKETNMEVTEDAIPEKPADPVREGYTFRGWYLDAAGETPYNFDTPLNADCTLYAVFDEKEYVVTYVVDGVSDAVTYKWSETPTYATPKKDGYVFKTWCLDEELTQHYVFIAPVQDSLTVYAKFAEAYKVQYVVTPNVNEEENDGVNTEIVETERETAPVKPQDPKVEGYDFEGWYLDKDFTEEYNFDTVLAEGSTIYAKLVEKQYVVTYMVGGTEDILSTVTYNYWDIPTQPETPTHNGEYFFGWYLDEAYENSYDFSYTFKQDTTVYAQFLDSKPIYTADELQAIKDYPAGNYALMNNINLETLSSDKGWEQIPTFSGKLSGNGYKVFNFSMTTTCINSGFIQTNTGTIKDLTLEDFAFNATYTGEYVAGALVGTNKGTVENCRLENVSSISYVMDNVGSGGTYNTYLGGIVGKNESTGVVKNCFIQANKISVTNNCNVTSNERTINNHVYIGGAFGGNYGKATALTVKANFEGKWSAEGVYDRWDGNGNGKSYIHLGGVVGTNIGTIEKSYYEGSMSGTPNSSSYGDSYFYVGGFARINSGEISECYAKATITETAKVCAQLALGGFVQNNSGTIRDCYADATVTTSSVPASTTIGGFVSINTNSIKNCYATGSITAGKGSSLGGFVAENQENGVVNTSFCSVNLSATTATDYGVFVGSEYSGSSMRKAYYNSEVSVQLNGADHAYNTDVMNVSGVTAAELYSTEMILDTLYWNTDGEIWVVDGENAPILAWQAAQAE